MAELRKITRNSSISNFQQVAPEAGGVFRVAKFALDTAYERLKPAATKQMEEMGAQQGRDLARSQVGDPLSYQTAKAEGVTASAQGALDGLQKTWGKPLNITSAFRTPEHNAKVGGAKNSQHTHGNAFDVDVSGMSQSERVALITQARSSGFKGIGVYDNSLHFDVGPDRAWGPSYHSDSLPGWAAQAVRAPTGGTAVSAELPAPTVVRTSSGKLEPRLYSPLSGEILQAHDAAEAVAYNSEIMLKGVTDMMAMSDQFALDPNGFKTAAQGYVDQLVGQAPEQFRTDLRSSLEKEMTRRFLGVMEDKQSDIRKRADNSSSALVERWADNLAQAKASGNKDEIDSATAELGSLLSARESLPGVAWTPEQSQNIFLDVDKKAESLRKQAEAEVDKALKDKLDTIATAAASGMHGADEAILDDASLAAKFPDSYRNAQVSVYIRDNLGSFRTASPAQQAAAIAEAKSIPVTDEGQVAVVKGLEDIHAATKKALDDDPIKWASENLQDKPPPLPSFDAGSPKTFIDALKARAAFGRQMTADGYIKAPAFLTNTEAETVGALMGKDIDPALKTLLSGAIVDGFGPDAATVFKEVKSDDPVTRFAGMMIARGGDQAVATMAMRGQQMLDQGLVQAPTKTTSVAAISPDIAVALGTNPAADQAQGDILQFATAIYAANARGVDPNSYASKKLMEQSVQTALGQATNRRGLTTGGVQKIGTQPVLLPINVAGADVEAALQKGMSPPQPSTWDVLTMQAPSADAPYARDAALWQGIGASMPMLGGQPVSYSMIAKGNVRLVPVSGSTYRMEVVIGGSVKTDIRDASGNLFTFDIAKLADAGR